LLGIPNSIPYHDLQNDIGAIQFVVITITISKVSDKSAIPLNSINSQENLSVNGRAKKLRHINIIETPKLGHI
jgi:hypothetical protein